MDRATADPVALLLRLARKSADARTADLLAAFQLARTSDQLEEPDR